jgi:NitT/TauT family transport system substrate-binding protein
MSGTLRIVVSRHSAFYSPLISTLAAGFVGAEGLRAEYGVLQPGEKSYELLAGGRAHVMQSAVSSNWKLMESGRADLPAHFAQINCRDGFFLVGRALAGPFAWRELEGGTLLADHGLQPLAMLRYAAHLLGVDWSRVRVLDAGGPERMEAAFRAGEGDYVHLQGPAAQRLEAEGAGRIAAAVGEAMPPVAFSSLCASRGFLATAPARAFLRAYGRSREWVRQAPAAEVARVQASYFPDVPPAILEAAVQRYQRLGCWEGGLEISRALYEQALDVFESGRVIARRHPYGEVVLPIEDLQQGAAEDVGLGLG